MLPVCILIIGVSLLLLQIEFVVTADEDVFRSPALRLSAKPDELRKDLLGRLVVVEHKSGYSRKGKAYLRHEMQVLLTCLLLESLGSRIKRGEVNYGGDHKKILIPWNGRMRTKAEAARLRVLEILEREGEDKGLVCSDPGFCQKCPYREECRP